MFLNQSGAQGGGGRGEWKHCICSSHFIPRMIGALCSHTYGGCSQTKVWKPFNVCMKEPASSSAVATRQYLQVFSDGRLKVNTDTFRIYRCSLFGSAAGVKSANLWCFFLNTLHVCCRRFVTFWTIGDVEGDEESQSPPRALYLSWNVTARRNTPRVRPFTAHSRVHSRHTLIDPASMTRRWSDDLQAGWENKPNGQMWSGRSAPDAAASDHICVSRQTTTGQAFPPSWMPCLKKPGQHQQLLL